MGTSFTERVVMELAISPGAFDLELLQLHHQTNELVARKHCNCSDKPTS